MTISHRAKGASYVFSKFAVIAISFEFSKRALVRGEMVFLLSIRRICNLRYRQQILDKKFYRLTSDRISFAIGSATVDSF